VFFSDGKVKSFLDGHSIASNRAGHVWERCCLTFVCNSSALKPSFQSSLPESPVLLPKVRY
jgi:hypothetical protein